MWSGDDLREQAQLDLEPNTAAMETLHSRLARVTNLADDATDSDAIVTMHQWFSQTPSTLIAVTTDDLVATRQRPNIPGATVAGRPNWSLALPPTVDELLAAPLAATVLDTVDRATHGLPERRRRNGSNRPGTAAGVLFDLDGTLVDSNYLHTVAWARALRDLGHQVPTSAVHRAIGMGAEQLLTHLIGSYQQTVADRRAAHFAELIDEVQPCPAPPTCSPAAIAPG